MTHEEWVNSPEGKAAMKKSREEEKARAARNDFDTFKVGDPVHWSEGTDAAPGTVSRITKGAIFVKAVKATLLNGVNSGEPDALTFTPGGFVGHTSGTQRHSFEEIPDAREMKFTKRAATEYRGAKAKQAGTSSKGSMASWGVLHHGHASHYDYNF